MKANQSSKSRNIKTAIRVLTIFVCISIAFSLIVVQQSEALFGIILVVGAVFVAGVLIGWWTANNHDTTPPDALVTSQENYVAVWNDFIEEWNNDYTDENVDLHNYMMMYNLTYLDSVRRAEHEVASYVSLSSWSDVENNMTTLIGYKENVTKYIISTLHGYNRIDVSVLQHMYDTDVWEYTTPTKYGLFYNTQSPVGYCYADIPLLDFGTTGQFAYGKIQFKVEFGTYPTGYNGDYGIGDKFYVTFIYVPDSQHITLKDLSTGENDTYYQGVYDFEGKQYEVLDVSICDSGHSGLDNTGVYLFGVPIDFDILQDTFINYDTGLTYSAESQTLEFETSKFINEVTVVTNGFEVGVTGIKLYIDGDLIETWSSGYSKTYTLNDYAINITTVPFGTTVEYPEGVSSYLSIIKTEGYIYHKTIGKLWVETTYGGSAYVTDNLTARGRIGLDWMVNSYKTIYNGMIVNAQILWNLYRANGWYSTDDIPSEFLVIPPDIIFDNMDALQNLPLDKAQAIYYAWMKQLIDFYDENPDYAGTYDDTNMTIFDDGIIFNASLTHGGKTIFTNHLIYISPLLEDLYLCKNNSYNLSQKIFIYDITANYIYYGYIDDNLTIQNITIEGAETDCVTLGRQTMSEFLMGKYGFSISFPAEWVFPTIENAELYMGIAIGCLGFGIPIAIFGKKYRPIGYLLIVIGSGIIIYVYVIPAIQSFIDFIIFWN